MSTFQHIILLIIPWELLFLIIPLGLVYVFLILKDRKKIKSKSNPRRKHFFS